MQSNIVIEDNSSPREKISSSFLNKKSLIPVVTPAITFGFFPFAFFAASKVNDPTTKFDSLMQFSDSAMYASYGALTALLVLLVIYAYHKYKKHSLVDDSYVDDQKQERSGEKNIHSVATVVIFGCFPLLFEAAKGIAAAAGKEMEGNEFASDVELMTVMAIYACYGLLTVIANRLLEQSIKHQYKDMSETSNDVVSNLPTPADRKIQRLAPWVSVLTFGFFPLMAESAQLATHSDVSSFPEYSDMLTTMSIIAAYAVLMVLVGYMLNRWASSAEDGSQYTVLESNHGNSRGEQLIDDGDASYTHLDPRRPPNDLSPSSTNVRQP